MRPEEARLMSLARVKMFLSEKNGRDWFLKWKKRQRKARSLPMNLHR